ncbi:MAG: YceI family protein [Deltaproteobacteria bacterium]|nr:YceI family protein [Deltaproteobacteria bacterium]
MRRSITISCTLALVCGLAATAQAANWKIYESHTAVGFSVSHLFTSVQGRFDRFSGTIEFDPQKPEAAVVRATVEAASINTNHEKRDKHLRSGDFFDVENHPTLSFESTSGVTEMVENRGKLAGNLTIHGVTKPVVFDVVFRGQGKDPWGNVRAGFSARLDIDRKDYGLTWNKALETGGVLVGDEVEIRIEVEGILGD